MLEKENFVSCLIWQTACKIPFCEASVASGWNWLYVDIQYLSLIQIELIKKNWALGTVWLTGWKVVKKKKETKFVFVFKLYAVLTLMGHELQSSVLFETKRPAGRCSSIH